MTGIHQKIQHSSTVLTGDRHTMTYAQLLEQAEHLAGQLINKQISVLALLAGNSPDWLVIDLACQIAGVCFLPLPHFFSNNQISHCLQETGCYHIMTDNSTRLAKTFAGCTVSKETIISFELITVQKPASVARLPKATAKITFTSGSTGDPKGVCLDNNSQYQVADALNKAIADHQGDHLCLLPLSTLLENVAGAYRALLGDYPIHLPCAQSLGFDGTRVDMQKLTACIDTVRPATMILVPELLSMLNLACKQGWQAPESLRFVAVGGAKVAPQLLLEAQCNGLPVYEGYGLSECCSVISLNTPANNRPGTAGKILPHQAAAITERQIQVTGAGFLGYVNQPQSWYPQTVSTGDLGWLDHDGFLHIKGRSKNLIISSFGRNINPEWLESELLADEAIQQAVAFGDRQPFCSALVYSDASINEHMIDQIITRLNTTLPEYARIRQWRRLPAPMTNRNGLLTGNGRPRRKAIADHYNDWLNAIYQPRKQTDTEVPYHDVL